MPQRPLTLQQVQTRRAQLQERMRKLEQNLADDYRALVAPPASTGNKMEDVINFASRTWVLIDGAMTGYKLFRRLGGLAGLFTRSARRR